MLTRPRRLVVVGTGLALLLLLALATALVARANQALDSIDHLDTSVSAPVRHLNETLDANAAGQMELLRAASSTGTTRSDFLARSIGTGEATAKAWTSYERVATRLPGAAALEARYRRDHAAGKQIAADVAIPILQSSAPAILPDAQLAAAERQREDLLALRRLYEADAKRVLASLDRGATRAIDRVLLVAALASVGLLLAGYACWRWASRVVVARDARAAAGRFAEFESRLGRALEMADTDHLVLELAAKAAVEFAPAAAASVVLSDASGSTFRPMVGTSSCGVADPGQCPAMRAGAPMRFADSEALDACPVLAADPDGDPCSVTCMPISVAGRDVALLQLTGRPHAPPAMNAPIQLVVRRVGERITMMRAFAQFELRASRDPLTGLLNRRSLADAVEQFDADDKEYAVVFADMDHFKRLNDVHGHDAGDRALRSFAHTLSSSLRPQDLCGRWGGEEFLVVMPDCRAAEAMVAMDRVRALLAQRGRDGLTAPVTVSIGVAQHDRTTTFAETVERADAALRSAKGSGRDRVVVWAPTPPVPAPAR